MKDGCYAEYAFYTIVKAQPAEIALPAVSSLIEKYLTIIVTFKLNEKMVTKQEWPIAHSSDLSISP